MKSAIASLLIMLFAGLAVFEQTDGFSVLTTESARRASVSRHPVSLPDTPLVTDNGAVQSLKDNLAHDGRTAIVNFIYTRCASVCIEMGEEFQQLQAQIQAHGLSDKIRLISISFDPRDTAAWLAAYQQHMQANDHIWQAMMASDDSQRRALLDAFGIIVVPAPMGQFEHNTAYHVVDADARLRRITDINDTDRILYYALQEANTAAQRQKP